jgi:predicted DNA-binding transcriptional regulator YafY
VTEREVEPLELAFVDKTWLLSAYCRLRQGQRAFRLDRIDRLALRDEHFIPREYTLGEARPASESFIVTVRFDPSIVRWVKERQHFTWVEEPTPAESIMTYHPRTFEQIELARAGATSWRCWNWQRCASGY